MKQLYHYTSTPSFESIIKNQCIRMTRSDFMNDPHDCQIFFDIVEDYINQQSMKDFIQKSSLANPKHTLELIQIYPVTDYMKFIFENIPLYIFSMTSENDSLPMWNYYGGQGLQLSFDNKKLFDKMSESLCTKEHQLLISTQVEYINNQTSLTDLKLNSFSDFMVNEININTQKVSSREHSIHHSDGNNLEYFVDSYIKSYLTTFSLLIERNGGFYNDSIDSKDKTIFFQKIFTHNKSLIGNMKLKFKADIDIYMLILATRYKPKTFENEAETRIVYLDYSLGGNSNECYTVSQNTFGDCLKPYIECCFKDNSLSPLIEEILLSPMTTKMPFHLSTYKKLICDFINKYNGHLNINNINVSKHDIRW